MRGTKKTIAWLEYLKATGSVKIVQVVEGKTVYDGTVEDLLNELKNITHES